MTPDAPEIQRLAAELESPQKIYEYMSKIRYVPDYFLKKPVDVLRLQEGDCDEQSVLLCSLLRAIGEDAYVRVGAFLGSPVLHAWVLWRSVVSGEWKNLDPSGLIEMVDPGYGDPGGDMPLVYVDFNDSVVYDYGGLAQIEYIFRGT